MAYAEKRAANPGALGLTIGLNAAAVIALAAWNPDIVHILTRTITTIDVPPVKPPPPEQVDTKQPQTKHVVDNPTKTVETKNTADDWRPEVIDIKPFTAGGGGIVEGGEIVEPPKPPIRSIVKTPPMMATPAGDL